MKSEFANQILGAYLTRHMVQEVLISLTGRSIRMNQIRALAEIRLHNNRAIRVDLDAAQNALSILASNSSARQIGHNVHGVEWNDLARVRFGILVVRIVADDVLVRNSRLW